ncbi:MAG TPA: hypothetical protein VMS55_25005 [Myxococcota bacterium]|nr:hypothetical protein [Myxococcota bacterium]
MARSSKMSVQKRARERKKAEQAELKREARRRADTGEVPRGGHVADRADLDSYGVGSTTSDPRDDR